MVNALRENAWRFAIVLWSVDIGVRVVESVVHVESVMQMVDAKVMNVDNHVYWGENTIW